MGGLMTFVGLLLIAASSWALGTLVLARLDWADLRTYERVSLELLAGLGLTAILLSLLTLAGGFAWNTVMLAVISAAGLVFAWRDRRGHDGPQGPSRNRSADLQVGRMNISALAIVLVALLGCIGAIAPVTDDDALAYVVPISRHIAATGHLAVWPDQVRSMWRGQLGQVRPDRWLGYRRGGPMALGVEAAGVVEAGVGAGVRGLQARRPRDHACATAGSWAERVHRGSEPRRPDPVRGGG